LESALRPSISQRVANYFSWRTSFSNSFATAFVMSAGLGSHLMGPEEIGGIEDLFGGF
jgi:hypothetical protein